MSEKAYSDGFLSHWGVAAKIGTYGPGVDIHTSLHPQIKARVGFNYLAGTYKDELSFTADGFTIDSHGMVISAPLSGYVKDPKLRFPEANILVDFYPIKSGIFSITAGVYMGKNKVTAKGLVTEVAGMPYDGQAFEFDDVIIRPNPDGSFDVGLRMGNPVKPYLGIGLGRTIPQSRLGFRFDMGVIYQGNYVVESGNIDSGTMDQINEQAADFDLPFSKSLLKWWPMLSLSLSYRIN